MNATRQKRFEDLLDEHRHIVYKVCHCFCRDRDDRDDLAQDIAVALWRSFESFDGRSRFSTWMYRIALNVAISFQRRERRHRFDLDSSDERLFEIAEPTQAEPENVRRLYEFVESLDDLDKALSLLYLDECSYREIAQTLGITQTNVATKLNRIRQRMKAHFCLAHASRERT